MLKLSTCPCLSLKLSADLIEKIVQARVSRRWAHPPMRIIHSRHYDYCRKGYWKLRNVLRNSLSVQSKVELAMLGY